MTGFNSQSTACMVADLLIKCYPATRVLKRVLMFHNEKLNLDEYMVNRRLSE